LADHRPTGPRARRTAVDALVAATAESLAPAVIVTGDPDGFALLAPRSDVRVLPLRR
jgi:sulfur relay (sulfurtransferase) DsrF/TusC family protein